MMMIYGIIFILKKIINKKICKYCLNFYIYYILKNEFSLASKIDSYGFGGMIQEYFFMYDE